VEVADSGSGIRRQDLSRLFVEFEQLDGSRAKRYQGTGLGLALTKRLAEGQGGTVGAESEIGCGSTFFVVLPREPLVEGEPEAPCVPMSAETVLP
jgi:signal transduction histidine kinase